ncbi:MAG: PEGA domain-containing protein [Thermoanaerobaculia bacterium]|nr:PEGA domain-containing protein [Thermoanaerobaculia bacterium]
MTHSKISSMPCRTKPLSRLGLAGALVALPALFLATSAVAQREPGTASPDTGSAPAPSYSAPSPSYSAPSPSHSSPSPSYSAPAPSAPRSAPAPSASSPSTPRRATAPREATSGAPGRTGRGVVSAEPRDGRSGGSTSATSGGGGGRIPGVVAAHPRGPGSGSHRHPRRRYYSPYTGWGGTSWWWGGPWDWWWWGSRFGPYHWGFGGVVIVEDYSPDPYRYARVDTDVSPEAAEVYLDGTFIGSADDFDGYPDFLWLEAGKYTIEFRHPSYETLKHEVEVRPGQALRFRDELKLEPGKKRLEATEPPRRGTPHGRVFGKPEERGRDRTGRFEARAEAGRERDRDREELDDLEELEELADELEESDEDVTPAPKARGDVKEGRFDREALPAERGRLRFEIEPADAAVYLDDDYVGTGEELAGLRRGVPVDAGKHTVSVVRPGFVTKTIEVEAKPGAAIDVVVELEK